MASWIALVRSLLCHYSGNGGTALAMMAKTRRITICLITALEQDLCERIGITRLRSEQVAHLLNNAHSSIAVIRNSSMLIR